MQWARAGPCARPIVTCVENLPMPRRPPPLGTRSPSLRKFVPFAVLRFEPARDLDAALGRMLRECPAPAHLVEFVRSLGERPRRPH